MTESRSGDRRTSSLAGLLVLALVGCRGPVGKQLAPRLPGARTAVEVTNVTARGAYLDAVLLAETFRLRFFFPANEVCERVLRAEDIAEYRSRGPLGQLQSGELICEPVGIASLAAWRDRRPRRSGSPVPRATARFEVIWADEEITLVRGRFPLAGQIGWTGGDDSIAVIPRTEACRDPIARGVASLEFYRRGPKVYELVSDAGLCPVIGFVLPLREP